MKPFDEARLFPAWARKLHAPKAFCYRYGMTIHLTCMVALIMIVSYVAATGAGTFFTDRGFNHVRLSDLSTAFTLLFLTSAWVSLSTSYHRTVELVGEINETIKVRVAFIKSLDDETLTLLQTHLDHEVVH